MAQNITLQGATYSAVPAVDLPKQGGGTARFTDVTPTTAAAADVASGKIFFASDGTQTTGTASGGGGSEYVVTLSWNSGTSRWEPDHGYAEIEDAYYAGKTIAVKTNMDDTTVAADGYYDSDIGSFLYYFYGINSAGDAVYFLYELHSNGTISTEAIENYVWPNFETVNRTYTPTTSTQTETVTYNSGDGYNGLQEVNVTVNAMPSGTAGTPTATKGTVNNHAISVTPSVTNTTGYITGGTKTGTAVSVAAAELVSGSETKTANGTYDVTNLAQIVVNVSGGGGSGLTLLATYAFGSFSGSSTSATDTGKSMTLTGYGDYDVLVVDTSVNTLTNGRHTSTVGMIYVTGTSNVNTKNTYAVGSNKWNSKLSSSGTGSTRQSTSAYGIYPNAATVSGSTMTITFYYRYNSNNTGTINGTYTTRVYGLKLYELIGG